MKNQEDEPREHVIKLDDHDVRPSWRIATEEIIVDPVAQERAKQQPVRQWKPKHGEDAPAEDPPEPVILEVFTSAARSRTPKKVFFPGDTLRFNIAHTMIPGHEVVTFEADFRIRRLKPVKSADDRGDFDIVFHPMIILGRYAYDHTWPSHVTYLTKTHPLYPPEDVRGSRTEVVEFVVSQSMWAVHGYWEFTGIIQFPDVTGRPFSLMSQWYYSIESPHQ